MGTCSSCITTITNGEIKDQQNTLTQINSKDQTILQQKLSKLSYHQTDYTFRIYNATDFQIEIISHAIKLLQRLKALHLLFEDSQELTDQSFEPFVGILNQSPGKGISDLKITLKSLNKISKPMALDLVKFIQSQELNTMSSFFLEITNCREFNDLALEQFQKILKSRAFYSLGVFGICLNMCPNLTLGGLLKTLIEIQNLRYLEEVHINLSRLINLDDDILEIISTTLRKLPQLLVIDLDIGYCDLITDQGVGKFFYYPYTDSFQKLKQFILNTQFCQRIKSFGMIEFANSIKLLKLKALSTVKLNLSGCAQLTNECVGEISSIFNEQYLPNLEIIHFSLNFCKNIGDEALDLINLNLLQCNLNNIQEVKFEFEGCNSITDQSLSKLFESSQILNNLQRINLNLSRLNNIEGSCFATLLQTFSGKDMHLSKPLKCLGLNISYSQNINYQSIATLSKILASKKCQEDLQEITLNISKISKLTNELLSDLLTSIQISTIKNINICSNENGSLQESFLKNLTISLSCGCFSELKTLKVHLQAIQNTKSLNAQIQKLCNSLQFLVSLRELKFDFKNNIGVGPEFCKFLIQAIKSNALRNLEKIHLDFTNDQQISEGTIFALLNYFKGALSNLQQVILVLIGCDKISSSQIVNFHKILTQFNDVRIEYQSKLSIVL